MLISNTACHLLEWTSPHWVRRFVSGTSDGSSIDQSTSFRQPPLFTAHGWPNVERYDANLLLELMEEEMRVTNATTVCRSDHDEEPLTVAEQKARAAAVRGLVNARDGRFDKARALFGEALSHDPALDLTQIPTFWKLPRGGQDAAVEAYQDVGMQKEAKILSSNLNYHFRPKLVRRRPRPVAVPSL
jgi:hypothetical protein